jgi:hypothetical protein
MSLRKFLELERVLPVDGALLLDQTFLLSVASALASKIENDHQRAHRCRCS